MSNPETRIGQISAHDLATPVGKGAVKTHCEYDGSNRLIELYVAPTGTPDGAMCSLTVYSYVGATNRIAGSEERNSTWDSSWDLP